MTKFLRMKSSSIVTLFNKCCTFSLLLLALISPQLSAKEFSTVEWVDLIPKADLDALLNPPQTLSAIPDGAPEDVLGDSVADSIERAIGEAVAPSLETQAYYNALESTNIKAEYDSKNIRIAGFVVPVEFGEDQRITEFFLVPYFGACIHLPPPPPNQIIYVKYPKGLLIDALYDPFWVEGQLNTEVIENDLATSAYALAADGIKPYQQYAQ